jgi:hypothetical protein
MNEETQETTTPAEGHDSMADKAKDMLGGLGDMMKKAGDAVVTAAEDLTGKDLNKDGVVGHEENKDEE